MFSGHRTKTSGKNPALIKGDYPEMRAKQTQQDLRNEGKKFKYSVLKKPWMSNDTYQEMEYIATPLGRGADMTPFAKFPRFGGLGDTTPPLIEGGEGGKYKCWCEGCEQQKGLNIAMREMSVSMGGDDMRDSVFVPDEYQCPDTGQGIIYFTVCGKKGEQVILRSNYDSIFEISEFSIPFPDESKCTTIDRCVCRNLGILVNCNEFDDCTHGRDIFIEQCGYKSVIRIIPSSSNCGSLTIVDEGGGAATDTILRNGSNDYKTTGNCCEAITWSASGTGASITQSGVLTAGATACGSLLVTATCQVCGTSDTQYVRVTDVGAGQWVEVSSCGTSVCSNRNNSVISGKIKNTAYFCCGDGNNPCDAVYACNSAGCCPLGTCDDLGVPHNCSDISGWFHCCTLNNKVYEWQC